MNTNYRRVPTEFGPETGFEVRPAPAPFRRLEENQLERLKSELLGERLGEATEPRFNSYLRRAANEAAALAWVTPIPCWCSPHCSKRRRNRPSPGPSGKKTFANAAGS